MVYVLLAPGFEGVGGRCPPPTCSWQALLWRPPWSPSSGPTVSGSPRDHPVRRPELSQIDLSNAEMLVLPGGLGAWRPLWADGRVSALIQGGR